jgi:hypothetical protein
VPAFPSDKQEEKECSGGEGAPDLGAGPPRLIGADQRPGQGDDAAGDQRDPHWIQALRGTVAFWEKAEAEGQRDDTDGHVDPEDPVPADPLGDAPADQRASGDRQRYEATEAISVAFVTAL